MSFGIGVGDFIAVFRLVEDIRQRFTDAPAQFKAISNNVKLLSNVFQNVNDIHGGLTDEQKTALDEIAGRDTISERLEIAKASMEEIHFILTAFNAQHELVKERRREQQAILDWLTPIDHTAKQNQSIALRQAGTGQWLLDSHELQQWLDEPGQTLFCPGIQGAGKTILISVVVQDIFRRFAGDTTIGISYMYCDFARHAEQKLDDMLASLLKQLACRKSSLPSQVKELYNLYEASQSKPNHHELCAALQAVAGTFSRIFIIIDALDEC
ncbi:hypothetical protein AJ80_02342 [Polytolypa hystricis UAMH7299]|uniref:Nephrocystin 3-like N-terminal domain-containing protein n=1 Tax=Polytolypa hystricis (strain UAMH7299) TaxID=1447883 RepID=A0A2B7YRS4_POLH7|nr:hypothetical protein AJ80_02342 [Polytolypa hystricis UAMH7299]